MVLSLPKKVYSPKIKSFHKKIIATTLFLFFTTQGFSIGAGVQTAIMPGQNIFNGDLKGTVKLMRIPLVFGFGIKMGIIKEDTKNQSLETDTKSEKEIENPYKKDYDKTYDFGVSGFADYRIIDYQLHNNINLFAEPGLSTRFSWNTEYDWSTEVGFRAIIGVDYLMFDNYIELYAQTGVEHIIFIPLSQKSEGLKDHHSVTYPFETGIRFHF